MPAEKGGRWKNALKKCISPLTPLPPEIPDGTEKIKTENLSIRKMFQILEHLFFWKANSVNLSEKNTFSDSFPAFKGEFGKSNIFFAI